MEHVLSHEVESRIATPTAIQSPLWTVPRVMSDMPNSKRWRRQHVELLRM
jgi:hypothetical protein